MTIIYGSMFPFGLFLVLLIITIYLEYYIKRSLFIGKIVSTPIMSIYLIFCILIALTLVYVLSEIIHQRIDNKMMISWMASLVITFVLLIGVYWLLFLPRYRRWKELLIDWVGINPEREINELREKIASLTKKIEINMNKQDSSSSMTLKIDVMYYKQKLDSLEKSRNAAKSMRVFVMACPVIFLILDVIWIWLEFW